MKSVQDVLQSVAARLDRSWAGGLAAEVSGDPAAGGPDGSVLPRRWPHAFPLGEPTPEELRTAFPAVLGWSLEWRDWAASNQVGLRLRTKRVLGTEQDLPTHLLVDDVDVAARLAGAGWTARLARGRSRAALLHSQFPQLVSTGGLPWTLAAVVDLTDVDVELLVKAGTWFTREHAAGLTPRQVPIEGMHAKWLNKRQHLVARLAGRDDLGLAAAHPPRVHFSYLDPEHRAAGGRWHDSVTITDAMRPAYLPSTVLISENKDTAINFPALPGAVSVEGAGHGGGTIAAVPWLVRAEHVFYWGDLDADGLEILDGFRAAGVRCVSMFMELDSYQRWERFGTRLDQRGKELGPRPPKAVPHLTGPERELYRALVSPEWARVRRIEQERIPLPIAAERVRSLTRPGRQAPPDPPTGDGVSGQNSGVGALGINRPSLG